jgi:DNA polymerase (family X)
MENTISSAATLQHNRELSVIFGQMADCYRYLGVNERFRAIAYQTASRTLANMHEPVDACGHDIKKLDELKGVGESIAGKIIEYIDTGHIKTFEQLKKKVPFELLDLMEIEGIGPSTVRLLHEEFHVRNKEELIAAIEAGKLLTRNGFGEKKITRLQQSLKINKPGTQRMPLATARRIGNNLLEQVKQIPGIHMASLAGSLRRQSDTVGDIDIVATSGTKDRTKIIKQFTRLPQVSQVLASGTTRASILLKENNVQADIRVVNDDEYATALFYFTGSREHNIQLRTIAKKRGWKINEYGVYDNKTNKKIPTNAEADIYALFGFSYIPPEKRTGRGELD